MTELLDARYDLGARLGSGGMADVYEAHDRRLGRRVAVKILKADVPDARARERFEREARTAAAFTHPCAVRVYDVGEDGQRPFIVMELVEGRTLASLLAERGPLAKEEACAIAGQVLDALGAAHARGLVHRDVKPGNVLITADGTARLADFGIAKAVSEATAGLTAPGQVMGTPKYFSPEQAAGQPATPRSDVYSVGVVLYEMLAGGPPFTGDTPVALAMAHQATPVPPLAERRPGLAVGLVDVVGRALEKDPARRYPDAGAMKAALDGAPTDAAAVAAPVATPPAVVPAQPQPSRRWSRRVRAPLGFLAVFAVAAALVAFTRRDDNGEQAGRGVVTVPPASEPAPTTTRPPATTAPRSTDDLVDIVAANPEVFGERADDLLKGLEDVLAKPGDTDKRAEKLIEDIDDWVAEGELDPSVGELAKQLLEPLAAESTPEPPSNGDGESDDD